MPKINTPHKKYHKLKSSALALVGCLVIAGCLSLAIGGGQPTNLFNLRQQQDNQPDPATASLASKQVLTPTPSQADPNDNIARHHIEIHVRYISKDTFIAEDNQPAGQTEWTHMLIDGTADCDADTINSGSWTITYIERYYLTYTSPSPEDGKKVCFGSRLISDNSHVDYQASPIIGSSSPDPNVRASSSSNSFKAADQYNTGLTTWDYVLITNFTCDSTTDFSGSTSYTEYDDVVYDSSNYGQRFCFRSITVTGHPTIPADNRGYGLSDPVRVIVSRGSVDNSWRANDNDNGTTTWVYFIETLADITCDSGTSYEHYDSYSYTEGDDVVHNASNNGKQICFRSTDSSGNHGWSGSGVINIDTTPPTVTVSLGSVTNSFKATDNDSTPTTWDYVLVTNNTCDSSTSFSGSTSYTEADDLVQTAPTNNGKKLCFRSTDDSDNHGYGLSVAISIDNTPPVVTVSRGSADNSFQANDDDNGTTTWDYVLITNNSCGSGTNFNNSSSYTEASDVVPTEADNTKQLCFRSTDSSGNHGYGSSTTINVDQTAPTVTVSRGSADDTFQANDNDSSPTTWAYVLITNNSCGSGTNFNNSSSYTEASDVVPTEADNTKQICFRSTDSSGNHGYGSSTTINVDQTAPVVTVSRGSADDTFQANDNDSSPTTWAYVLVTNNTCNSTTSFSGSSSYNEGDDVVQTASNNGKKVCFRSTDGSDNAGYGSSATIYIDNTAPVVTVSRGSADDTFQANDNDSSPTTWAYVLITNTTCNSTTNFNNSSSYTEGDDVVPTEADNTKQLCFRSTDSSGNHGYASSTTINVDQTAPVVTVSQGSVDDSFQANDNDSSPTTWAYVLVTNNSCGSGTNFNNSSSYTEGDDVVPTEADNTKQLCFRSTDSSGNHGYGRSTTIICRHVCHTTAPVVTVSAGSAADSFKAVDDETASTDWAYVLITNNTCDSTTNFSGSSSYNEGDDVVQTASNNGKKLCFRSTDSSDNAGYGVSDVIDTLPIVRVRRGSVDDSFKATDNVSASTSWAYVLITNNTCDSTTDFNNSTSYTEGDDVVPTEADNTKKVCFRSTDSSNHHGYGKSATINIDNTPPVVTVSQGDDILSVHGNSFLAVDDDSSATTWRKVLITNNTTCDGSTPTLFIGGNGASSYDRRYFHQNLR